VRARVGHEHPTPRTAPESTPAPDAVAGTSRLPPRDLAPLHEHVGNRALTREITSRRLMRDNPVHTPAPPQGTPGREGVQRPTSSGLVTIAQGAINTWYGAASGGLEDFVSIVKDQPDWGTFWLNIAGNVIWATACLVSPEVGIVAVGERVAAKQFVVSLAGIATSAAATKPSSFGEFRTAAVDKHLNAINTQLNNQVDAVTSDVDKEATAGNWNDNRTRLELLNRLMKPEFITVYQGGIPNVDAAKVRLKAANDLFVELNELANMRSPHVDSTGLVIYHYDVSGAVDHSTLVDSVQETRFWGFKLTKVEVSLPSGGDAAVESLKKGGRFSPAKTKFNKQVKLTAPGARMYVQDNEWQIDLDPNNKVTTTWPGGIFLSMDDPDEWAAHALARMWPPSGLPPDIDSFEVGPSWW
jgi:hypothetical protein